MPYLKPAGIEHATLQPVREILLSIVTQSTVLLEGKNRITLQKYILAPGPLAGLFIKRLFMIMSNTLLDILLSHRKPFEKYLYLFSLLLHQNQQNEK